ncbi:MAG: NAD(P)H-dependent oxidoreductase subunit E [Nitrospirae bacterium]|nr:NAD(P)H-dependent oxidoreductase subunit E [Nitrospirota bacterium]
MNEQLEHILRTHREKGGSIIALLQDTQEAFGYIPKEAVDFFSEELNIAPSRFFGVATFYSQFRLKPCGRNRITACSGTACHVRGAEKIIGSLRRELALSGEEDTTKDGEFTLDEVACLGTCSFAPVVLINGAVYGKTEADSVVREIRTIRKKSDE